jgi:hypothetical protein
MILTYSDQIVLKGFWLATSIASLLFYVVSSTKKTLNEEETTLEDVAMYVLASANVYLVIFYKWSWERNSISFSDKIAYILVLVLLQPIFFAYTYQSKSLHNYFYPVLLLGMFGCILIETVKYVKDLWILVKNRDPIIYGRRIPITDLFPPYDIGIMFDENLVPRLWRLPRATLGAISHATHFFQSVARAA